MRTAVALAALTIGANGEPSADGPTNAVLPFRLELHHCFFHHLSFFYTSLSFSRAPVRQTRRFMYAPGSGYDRVAGRPVSPFTNMAEGVMDRSGPDPRKPFFGPSQ